MNVELQYYGMIAELFNTNSEMIDIPEGIESLREFLLNLKPELNEMTFTIAIDQEITEDFQSNQHVKVIALLPPFAGG